MRISTPKNQFLCLLAIETFIASSFPMHQDALSPRRSLSKTYFTVVGINSKKDEEPEISFLLEDFQTAKGSLVNPYEILGVARTATKIEIKQSYRKLSRKLHPDMVMNRAILPGKCANLDEVREEWEKVKLSYEILTDKKMRKKYDRNSAVADPGAAIGRAAMSAVGWGIMSVGQGVWTIGEKVVKAGVSSATNNRDYHVSESRQEGNKQ